MTTILQSLSKTVHLSLGVAILLLLGLHSHDIKKLLEILQAFANTGNTVVVIEHNLDVIKTADYIVDMGPEGGVKGGNIVAEGKPEEVCKVKDSYTGQFLKPLLA